MGIDLMDAATVPERGDIVLRETAAPDGTRLYVLATVSQGDQFLFNTRAAATANALAFASHERVSVWIETAHRIELLQTFRPSSA